MHPNEVDGWIRALSMRARAQFGERDSFDLSNDDDRDAGVGVRREPRSPNKAGGIAVPEPDDDQALNLVSTEQARTFMNRKRKIIVHIATSADGFIARPDGNLNGAMQVHYDVRTTR